MVRTIVLLLSVVAATAWALTAVRGPAARADGVEVTVTPAPDRNGATPGKGQYLSCPPGPLPGEKATPDAGLGDTNVCGDSKLDFFMGEWKFIKGNENLIVREWCCNADPGPHGEFEDFFTLQIFTSLNSVETERVAPGVPT